MNKSPRLALDECNYKALLGSPLVSIYSLCSLENVVGVLHKPILLLGRTFRVNEEENENCF